MSAPTDTAEPALVVEDTGAVLRVRFPVLAIEGMDTGDGRYITPGGLGCRPPPLSLAAQPYDPHGGQDSPAAEVFGKITKAERHPGSEVTSPTTGEPFGDGVFVWSGEGEIDGAHRWADLVRKGYLRGVSIVMGEMDAEIIGDEEAALSEHPRRRAVVNGANIACATLVPVPAFADAHLELDESDTAMVAAAQLPSELHTEPVPPWLSADLGDELLADELAAFAPTAESRRDAKKQGDTLPGTDKYPIRNREELRKAIKLVGSSDEPDAKVKAHIRRKARELDAEDMIPDSWAAGDAVVAAASSDIGLPPIQWFRNPNLPGLTPLTVDEDGHCYGHLAGWHSSHTGFPGRDITPPRSYSDYAYFHAGSARVLDGDAVAEISVGHLTMDTGHASTMLAQHSAAAHYDDTGTLVANVCAGEDEHGIWFSGAVLPGVDELRLHRFRSCGLSGDWRRIGTGLELVAALSVPVPGFPVPRARVASGAALALVAAGALHPEPSGVVLDYDTLAAAIASRLRASDADERERAALAAELADDDSDEERLAALAGLDEGEEFAALAAFVAEHADADDAAFASLMPPQLQRSYLAGKVAARIAWGTPGDFRRCVVQAKGHGMGRKAEGACNYLHNKAVGFYPGDRRNR